MLPDSDIVCSDIDFESDIPPFLCTIPEDEQVVLFSWAGYELEEGMDSNCAQMLKFLNSFDIFDQPAYTTHSASPCDPDADKVGSERETAIYINDIVRATRVRHSRQKSAFMLQSPGRRDDEIPESFSAPRIGGTQCNACNSNPSHRLIPCHHSVCYDHFLAHDEESHSLLLCARCLKSVTVIVDINKPLRPSDLLLCSPLSISPQGSIWGSPPQSFDDSFPSLDECIADMAPTANGVVSKDAHVNGTSSSQFTNGQHVPGWGFQRGPSQPYHNGTSHPMQYAPPHFDQQQFAGQGSASKPFAPYQAFRELNPQAMRGSDIQNPLNMPQSFGNQQQQMKMQYPVNPIGNMEYQNGMGARMQPPVGTPSQPPFGMAPPSAFGMKQSNMIPNPLFQQQPQGAFTNGNAGMPMGYGMSAANDPFVDHFSAMNIRPGFNAAGSHGMVNGHHGLQYPMQQANGHMAVMAPQAQTEAARMAQYIKEGNLEKSDCKSPPAVRGFIAPDPNNPGFGSQPVQHSKAVMVPEMLPDPAFLGEVANGVRPTLEQVFEHVPFVEHSRVHQAVKHGVIKIGNIPYGTTKNEVAAVLGRSARIASQPRSTAFYGIHIIMERSTGKTMDCYVELETVADAKNAVANFQNRVMSGRAPRIGERHVEIELSSQEALMLELFPRAKCVKWEGMVPRIYTTDEPFNSGFNGFVTGEEMVMVQKHAETPQRSPFAQRCHNRTYESMISVLHKYPWYSVDNITVSERTLLFKCTLTLLRTLITAINRNSNPAALNRTLLQEFLIAALGNAGFNHQQKAFITDLVQCNGFSDMLAFVPTIHLGPLGGWWAFECLSKKPDVSNELLEYYISLLREAAAPPARSTNGVNGHHDTNGTLAHRAATTPVRSPAKQSPFGKFAVQYPVDKAELTLARAAMIEWDAIEEALRKGLPSGGAILTIREVPEEGTE